MKCSLDGCYPDTSCAYGLVDRNDCDYWSKTLTADEDSSVTVQPTHLADVPWNSFALGTHDLPILAARGPVGVIGLVGPSKSGKTSLLAFLYMWLLKHGTLLGWQFAGSWTLGGWESLVQYSRWTSAQPPTFPPHTSSAGRYPGLLHLSVRREGGPIRDVVFTDAPGEWFKEWSRRPDSPGAEGARWVMARADTILLLVDSNGLSDPEELPKTRRLTRDLMERVGALATCSTGVVWTKSDVLVPNAALESISSASKEFLSGATLMKTTTDAPKSIAACFSSSIDMALATRPTRGHTHLEARLSDDPFLAYRRTRNE